MESRFQVELLKRQYLQLLEPSQLSLPPPDVLKRPQVQAEIYDSMFREGCLVYEPADRYKLRVLKRLIHTIEGAVSDPDEDVWLLVSARSLPFLHRSSSM